MKPKKGKIVKEKGKDGRVNKLEAQIRRLKRLNKELISKLRSAETALERTIRVLKGSVEDVSVEELIAGAKEDKTIKEIKDAVEQCPKCPAQVKIIEIKGGKVIVCPDCSYRSKK